jgi:3-methylcrotonyl-CoA carboxylase alpha subunit
VRLVARYDGADIPVEIERHGGGYRVRIGDRWIEADLADAGPVVRSLRLEDGTQFALIHHRDGARHEVSLADSTVHVEMHDPLALKRRRREDEVGGSGTIKALMPGRIVRVMVKKGDAVQKGTPLMVLEAMKMENEIVSPAEGVVDDVFIEAGQTVEGGAELLHIA